MSKPILCLDFDGVLHSYKSGWKGAAEIPDPPVDGAVDFLIEAVKNFDVQIFSSRSHQEGGLDAMRRAIYAWFLDAGYPAGLAQGMCWDRVEHGNVTIPSALGFPREKPAALVSIDDRAIQFTGFFPPMSELVNFKPWNKR